MAFQSILGLKHHSVPHFPDIKAYASLKEAYALMSEEVDQIETRLTEEPRAADIPSLQSRLVEIRESNSVLKDIFTEKLKVHSFIISDAQQAISPHSKINKKESQLDTLYLDAICTFCDQFQERIQSVFEKTKLSASNASPPSTSRIAEQAPKPSVTIRISACYRAKHKEKLFIRGNGAGLTWDKGVEMKREGKHKWSFTTTQPFSSPLEFKFLRNDITWEKGHNHHLESGKRWTFRKLHF